MAEPANPRAALVADLAEHVKVLVVAGDLEAARVAGAAIARLLGSASDDIGNVVDLSLVQRGAAGR